MPFQGEVVQTGFVVDRTYVVKEFKHEKERKQLDLPAKKNVLTNYFCTASLEAKRKFRAPRITPNHFDSMEGSDSSSERNESDKTNKDSETCKDYSPVVSMEDGFAATAFLSLESSIGNLRSSEHSVPLELTRLAVCKPCPTLRKERECKLTLDVVESKTRSVNKKVIVRSSYFKHKSTNDNDNKNENEKPVSEKDTTSGILSDSMSTESAPIRTNKLKSAMKKRDAIPIERTQNEFVKVKHARTDETVPSEGDPVDSRCTLMGTEEGNFGCNISHLSHYSNVAEKSMERFVSIVSAFACKSSGSRASGLRAPLKDVYNTVATRYSHPPRCPFPPNFRKAGSQSVRVLAFAVCVIYNFVIPVISRGFEDEKNYYPSPDTSVGGSPPSISSPPIDPGVGGTPPSGHGSSGSPPHRHHGHHRSPPSNCGTPSTPTYPGILTPPSSSLPPLLPDPNSPIPLLPGTCTYWSTHPTAIWGLLGWWGTMGDLFHLPSSLGTSSSFPGVGLTLPQALSNTRQDGLSSLYREGAASLLNSMANPRFPYSTQQVRDQFTAAIVSDRAAAAQANLFRQANEGRVKPRV
ncbi:Protodermal factor [Thalictrum thalictroides]|uniref:Protodermal factor n=1 Tax=Thalictrum thalictroides TaxID=46969 RepID=A0A7J6UU91_THATH|nr:Protodermal factor [Thalictrum thalictroides]